MIRYRASCEAEESNLIQDNKNRVTSACRMEDNLSNILSPVIDRRYEKSSNAITMCSHATAAFVPFLCSRNVPEKQMS